MCDCLKAVLSELKDQAKAMIPAHDPESLQVRWINSRTMPVEVTYWRLKISGERHKYITTDRLTIEMICCPFCGEKIHEDSAA